MNSSYLKLGKRICSLRFNKWLIEKALDRKDYFHKEVIGMRYVYEAATLGHAQTICASGEDHRNHNLTLWRCFAIVPRLHLEVLPTKRRFCACKWIKFWMGMRWSDTAGFRGKVCMVDAASPKWFQSAHTLVEKSHLLYTQSQQRHQVFGCWKSSRGSKRLSPIRLKR